MHKGGLARSKWRVHMTPAPAFRSTPAVPSATARAPLWLPTATFRAAAFHRNTDNASRHFNLFGLARCAGFNTVLRYLSPLAVGLATTLEPLVGPLIGWLLGVMQPPGLFTYAGGALVFASTVVVTVASGRRARAEAEAEKQGAGGDVALAEVFKEFQDAEMERESLLGSDWS